MTTTLRCVCCCLFILAGALCPRLSAQVRFYGIGDLPGGIVASEARDATKVNGIIYVVGNSAANPGSTGGDTAVLWTSNGGLRALPNLVTNTTGTTFITASAITPNASFIASRARSVPTGGARSAVRVTVNGLTNLDLGTLPGLTVSAAVSISADGAVLYGFAPYLASGQSRAVRFQASDRSITPLPFPTAGHDTSVATARGTSADGTIMVGISSNSATNSNNFGPGSRAFRYVHGTGSSLIPLLPGGTWNAAVALTPNGNLTLVVGDSTTAPQGEAYLHTASNGAITRLDSPNGTYSPNSAAGLTADGSVVVLNFNESATNTGAYLRNSRGWHDLQDIATRAGVDLKGWNLDNPSGISPDGTLVWGSGRHNGNREGWVLEFPAGYLAAYAEPVTYSNPGRAIVGAWTMGNPAAEGATVLVFYPSGYYIHIQDATAAEVRAGGADGFERGQFTWDAATGAFTSRPLLDQNGSIGLSPGGNAVITVNGDTLTLRASDGTYTLTRVAGTSPLVGAYGTAHVADGALAAVFLPSGHYFLAQDGNANAATGGDPSGQDGIERGTYVWNATTGVITVTPVLDTNGQWGFSHSTPPLVLQPSLDGAIAREGSAAPTFTPRVKATSVELPVITTQPVAQSVWTRQKVVFTVAATGTAPFTYQWKKDGENIAGATRDTFGLAEAQLTDAGRYACVVANSVGATLSEAALLTVTPSFAGTYFGEFANGRGHWALVVLRDGTGTFVAYLTSARGGIVVPVRVGRDGTFRVTGEMVQVGTAPRSLDGRSVAAASTPVTVSGTIGTTSVTGNVEGPNVPFTGTPDPATGETAPVSGLYQASGAAGSTTYTVVGTNRTVLALTVGSTLVNGGIGTVSNTGVFSVLTADKVNITGTVTTSGTLTGSVAPEGGAAIAVTGTAVEAIGPPVIATPPVAQSAIAGAPVTVTVEARGAPLSFQWRRNGSDIAGATAATYTIAAAQAGDAADYTCVVTNPAGSVTTAAASLTVTPYRAGRLVNLSILTDLPSPGDSFTLGTVIGGAGTSGPKALLVRAAGPSLGALGVPGTLSDPNLEAFFGTTKTGENDNWGGTTALTTAFAQVGAFPFMGPTSRDAALYNAAVSPGNNSIRVSGIGNATGSVIAELYESTPAAAYALTTPRLVNVSVLKEIGSGFTLGFVIAGETAPTVLIRAVGPGLAGVGVTSGALRDPRLTLYAGTNRIEENDNWGGGAALTAAMAQVGAFAVPANSLDAAVLATLQPGSYSVQISGTEGATGLVIVEVYEVR